MPSFNSDWVYIEASELSEIERENAQGITPIGYFINLSHVASILEYSSIEGKTFFSVDVNGQVLVIPEDKATPLLEAFSHHSKSPSVKRFVGK
jgi:hypothetical protein